MADFAWLPDRTARSWGVWAQLLPAERQLIVQLLVDRVTLREEGIEITWRDTGWHTLAGEMQPGTIGAEL